MNTTMTMNTSNNDLTKETSPALLAALIDQYVALDLSLSVQRASVAAAEQEMTLLESRIGDEMQRAHLREAGGMLGRAEFKPKRVYKVDAQQWTNLFTHIRDTGEFDLLHRRLSSTAVEERVRIGAPLPPGVGLYEFDQLNIKARKK